MLYSCLTSVFSKIIERLMYSRLLSFINKHKILNKLQFGFRNNHSTFMALVILVVVFYLLFCVCVCFLTTLHPLHSQNDIFLQKFVNVKWLMICYETVANVREYKLHFFLFCFAFFIVYSSFFPRPIWHSSCLTDIGAHKPWLLAPVAMCAYVMYYIPSYISNVEICVYDLMYLCIHYMAIKFFRCHCQ